MRAPTSRRWLVAVGVVLALPLAGLLFLKSRKDAGRTLEAGPLTAEVGVPPADAPPSTDEPLLRPPAPAAASEEGTASGPPDIAAPAVPGAVGTPGMPLPQGRLEPLQKNGAGGEAPGAGPAEVGEKTSGRAEDQARTLKAPGPGKPGAPKEAPGQAKPRSRVENDPGAELERAISLGKLGPGVGSAEPFMQALLKAKPGSLLFDPKQVIATGGRAGQGPMSMETNSRVTPENFNPKAAGLSSSKGQEPPGPKIPAGKAPALPSAHLKYILQAAQATGVDPALIAATAARESNFRYGAYRAEPHLKQVMWRETPSSPAKATFDGSLGPMQVLRSNFLARGINNDQQANDLTTNYRVGAQIIRADLSAFPNSTWKAVAAYNVGVYGAKSGRVPAGNYTNTILDWRKEYDKAMAPYR